MVCIGISVMCLNELEKLLIRQFLEDEKIEIAKRKVNLDLIEVSARELTGAGSFTQLKKCDELKVSSINHSFKWGKLGAKLNSEKIDTGYLIYIEKGYIDTIEGYTYGGDDWPEEIYEIEIYDL